MQTYSIRYNRKGILKEVSIRIARKNHRCRICGGVINPKEKYISVVYGDLYVGHIKSLPICLDCWRYIQSKLSKEKKKLYLKN